MWGATPVAGVASSACSAEPILASEAVDATGGGRTAEGSTGAGAGDVDDGVVSATSGPGSDRDEGGDKSRLGPSTGTLGAVGSTGMVGATRTGFGAPGCHG